MSTVNEIKCSLIGHHDFPATSLFSTCSLCGATNTDALDQVLGLVRTVNQPDVIAASKAVYDYLTKIKDQNAPPI